MPGIGGLPDRTHACAGGAHSRLADGTLLCWTPELLPGERVAIDAEYSTQPVPEPLARRFGSQSGDFWGVWTAVEVSCKLRDVPLLAWLRQRGLHPDPDLDLCTLHRDGLTLSIGLTTHPRHHGRPAEPGLS